MTNSSAILHFTPEEMQVYLREVFPQAISFIDSRLYKSSLL